MLSRFLKLKSNGKGKEVLKCIFTIVQELYDWREVSNIDRRIK